MMKESSVTTMCPVVIMLPAGGQMLNRSITGSHLKTNTRLFVSRRSGKLGLGPCVCELEHCLPEDKTTALT